MLKKRKPAETNIDTWLQQMENEPSTPVKKKQQLTENAWQLNMHNTVSEYDMTIQVQDERISYASILTPDVEGEGQAGFYGDCLELNGKMNDLRLGRENGSITLSKEDPQEGFNPLTLGRSIQRMDDAQQELVPKLYKSAEKHKARLKKYE